MGTKQLTIAFWIVVGGLLVGIAACLGLLVYILDIAAQA